MKKAQTKSYSVTLTEVITYEITKDVELTYKEYAMYLKTGSLSHEKDTELQHELSAEVQDSNHICTEHFTTDISQLTFHN